MTRPTEVRWDGLAIDPGAVLDSIFEQAGFGLGLWDTDLRFVRVNPALAEINRREVEEHLGRHMLEVRPDMPDAVVEACRRVVETGEPATDLRVEGPGVDEDGTTRTFSCSYYPVFRDREVVGLWASVTEVTAERRAREAAEGATDQLARERNILREVLARAPAPMVVQWGEDLRFTYVNDLALDFLPARGDLLERSAFELFPEGATEAAKMRDAVLLRGETVQITDAPIASAAPEACDGYRYYTFTAVPIPGSDGRPAGMLNVGLETTEEVRRRRGLERELEEEHRIATQLQVSLMPERLPVVPGMDIASGFRPAAGGTEIGGDFFDVFQLAESCWMVVIGDVCGKGAEAAALTALARYTLRAAAMQEGAEPSELLGQLNEAMLRQRDDMRFLSAVCAFLDIAEDGGVSVRLSTAGHLPPLLVREDGSVTALAGGEGVLLGVWESPRLAEEVLELQPGDRLVLYTDGVLDAQRDELTEAQLATLLGSLSRDSAAETVAGVERAVLGDGDAPGRDDVALLVLRRQRQ